MTMERELLGNLKKKPVTLRFPHERRKRVKGMRTKVTWEVQKCIGCTLCATMCPSNAIELVGEKLDTEILYYVGRCLFCGECVDVCPTNAVQTTTDSQLIFIHAEDMTLEFRRTKGNVTFINEE